MIKFKKINVFLQAFLLGLLLISCSSQRGKQENIKLNILLITSEDNGPQLGCYGDPYCKTPNLDKMASEGFRFTNAYVTQAGCSESRASIFTGLFPHQNGQIGLATHNLSMYNDSFPNIFSELRLAGYKTGIIGKIHVNPESSFPLDYHSKIIGGFNNRNVRAIADTAFEFFTSTGKPFILMVNYRDAHRPFIKQTNGLPEHPLEPGDIEELPEIGIKSDFIKEQTANYYNCIMRLDAGISMLFEKLEECGKRENTIIIYLGDHGQDILRGKRTSYEGGTKIPLIIYCPDEILSLLNNKANIYSDDDIKIKKGTVNNQLVSTIDILPTILEIAGIELPGNLPGKSLVPFFQGENPEWRKYLFTEFNLHSPHNYYPQRTIRNKRFKLIYNLMPNEINPGYDFTLNRFFNVDTLNSKLENAPDYIVKSYKILKRPPKYELYDLENDPNEFHNLAEDSAYTNILNELILNLTDWQGQTNDPLIEPENLYRLKAEVDSCWSTSEYVKKKKWYYPEYFLNKERGK
ncbi:MAG: sulfatase [Bacteroidales bacterium]|nr:sulfatase [Bacteroidales bacterium]